jgi:hypothetical protein
MKQAFSSGVALSFFGLLLLAMPALAGDNLLANGGFEQIDQKSISEWSLGMYCPYPKISEFPHPTARLDENEKHDGLASLRLDCTSDKDNVIINSPTLPVNAGDSYRLSFWLKNDGGKFSLRQNLHGEDGKHLAARYMVLAASEEKHDWRRYEMKFAVKPGEKGFSLTAFFTGENKSAWVDSFNLEKVEPVAGEEVKFRLTPNFDADDNIYHLPQGAPMIVYLTVANESQYQPKTQPEILVDLPEGVELLGGDLDSRETAPPAKLELGGKPYVRYSLTMGFSSYLLGNVDFTKSAWRSTLLMLRTNKPAGDEIMDAYISFKDGEYVCKPCLFRLKVIPPLTTIYSPRRFRSACVVNNGIEFSGKPLAEWSRAYAGWGFNEILVNDHLRVGGSTPEAKRRDPSSIIRELVKNALTVSLNCGRITNGYMVRYTPLNKDIPEEVLLKQATGVVQQDAFDPAYIYRRGEWYVKLVNWVLDDMLAKGASHLVCNWEPWMYRMERGSFTERSIRDFARWSGKPESVVLGMNPIEIVTKWPDELKKFQSWQYKMAMRTLNEIVRKKSVQIGRKIDFIPWVGPHTLFDLHEGAEYQEYIECFNGADYAEEFDYLASWHYRYFKSVEMHDPAKKRMIELGLRHAESKDDFDCKTHRQTLDRVEHLVGQIEKFSFRAGRQAPPYIHLTQNKQCDNWVVKPESIGLQMLAAFIGGAKGLHLYYFPQGYDGRYWRSAIEANRAIAYYENDVLDGEKLASGFSLTPKTACFAHADYRENLAIRAFRNNGWTLLALCNFDFLDEAVFDLHCENLTQGKYVLRDPLKNSHYTFSGKAALDAEMLKKITLTLPKMTIRFLRVESFEEGIDYGETLPLETVAVMAEKSIPELDRLFAARLEEIKTLLTSDTDKEVIDYSLVPRLEEDGFSAGIKEVDGAQIYCVESGENSFSLDPSRGAVLTNWKSGGQQMIVADKVSGMIGKTRAYLPDGYMSNSELQGCYRFISQVVKGDALHVVFARKVTAGTLAGVTVMKNYAFRKSGIVDLTHTLHNESEEDKTAGLWIFSAPMAFSKSAGEPGLIFGGESITNHAHGETLFVRKNSGMPTGYADKVKSILRESGIRKITGGDGILGENSLRIKSENEKLYGVFVWGSARSSFLTYELIYQPVTLKSGQQWSTIISLDRR